MSKSEKDCFTQGHKRPREDMKEENRHDELSAAKEEATQLQRLAWRQQGQTNPVFFNKNMDELLLRERAAGRSIEELSIIFNRQPAAIQYRLRRVLSIGPQDTSVLVAQAPNHNKLWDPADRTQLQHLYQQGKSVKWLAEHFGRTEWGIFCQLEKLGYKQYADELRPWLKR